MHNQTPRYPLEVQIHHNFVISDNSNVTNKYIKVNRAVISLLYSIGSSSEGDEFLEQMGVSKYNKVIEYNIASPEEFINQGKARVGIYDLGFNIRALQGLLAALNADPHIFHYYGSETLPPCREEVLWLVYARPRSLSDFQFEFLKTQLAHSKLSGRNVNKISNAQYLYGNKRSIQDYNDQYRGKIYSNKQSIRQVKRRVFFKSKIEE